MPKVNFYLLKQSGEPAQRQLACKLAEQLARQGQRVYLQLPSADDARELDQLLWSFSAESFVPHALVQDAAAKQAQVQLGCEGQMPPGTTCLINLAEGLVPANAGIATVAEFVLNDNLAKARGRARWNAYKEAGFELQHHQL